MMDVRLLELFVGVAEEGSIHGGARRLMIAQSAVSKGLQRLERQVGMPLVRRSHQGIELTEAGQVLLVEAREIFDRIGRAMTAVRETSQRNRKITVGLIAGAVSAGDLTKEIVHLYRRQHPGVEVSLRELGFPDQFKAVANGDVDVALIRPPCHVDELDLEVLFDEPLMLCCAEDHELADAGELALADILDQPMLDLADAPREWIDFWQLRGFRDGPARTAGNPASTLSQLQMAVSFGGIVTPVAASAWRLGLTDPTLRAIPLRDAPRSEVAVASRMRETRGDVTEFVTCARETTRALIDCVPEARVRR
jgi:DNA-binding transcriptional LysR family regulator